MKLSKDKLNDPIVAHVRHDVTTVQQDQTVGETLAQMRREPLGAKIVYIYVLGAEGRLVGVLPTRNLLSSEPEKKIAEVMVAKVVAIPYLATVLEACEWFIQYRFLALPVIDGQKKLVGVVDLGLFTDEIIEVSERASYENVFQLIGVHIADAQKASAWEMFRGRFPWLLCNIGGGLACAFLAGRYEKFLDGAIVLALFIPVVLALAESVGMQSMTITLQRLHGQGLRWSEIGRMLRREFLTSLGLGLACGVVVGGTAWLWKGHADVGVAISVSIALSIVTSCLLGVALPSTVHALKVDPKIAAGSITLACVDLTTLLFYFNLSMAILS